MAHGLTIKYMNINYLNSIVKETVNHRVGGSSPSQGAILLCISISYNVNKLRPFSKHAIQGNACHSNMIRWIGIRSSLRAVTLCPVRSGMARVRVPDFGISG